MEDFSVAACLQAGLFKGRGRGSNGGEPPEGSVLLTLAVYKARGEGGSRLGRAAAREGGRWAPGKNSGIHCGQTEGRQALVDGLPLGWTTLHCRLVRQRQRQLHLKPILPYILSSLMPTVESRVDLA